MFMHSGDVMVMTGQSRLLYHAVPRIVPAPPDSLAEKMEGCCEAKQPVTPSFVTDPLTEEDWSVCSKYIQSSRINMTVRQVLGPNQCFPESPSSAHQLTGAELELGHQDEAADGSTSVKRKKLSP